MHEEYTAAQSPEWESAGFDVAAFLDAAAQSPVFRRKRPPLDVAAIMDKAAGREVCPASEEKPDMTVIGDIPQISIIQEVPEFAMVEEIPEPTIMEEIPEPTMMEEIPEPTMMEELPEPTMVEEIPEPTVMEELPEPTMVEELPEPTVMEELPEPTMMEELPEHTMVEEIPEPTMMEEIPEPVIMEEIPEPTIMEEIPEPTMMEEIPEPTIMEKIPEAIPEEPIAIEEIPEAIPEEPIAIEEVPEVIPEEPIAIEEIPEVIPEEPIVIETIPEETQKAVWEDEELIQLQEILNFADRGCTLQQLMARYDRLGKSGSRLQGICREGERAFSAQEAAQVLEAGNILHCAVDSSVLWGKGAPMGGPVQNVKMADHWVAFTGVRRNSDGSFRDFEMMDEGELRFVTASQYTALCLGSQMTEPVCFLVGKAAAAVSDGQEAPETRQAPPAQVWEVAQPFAQDELYARFAACPEDSDQAFELLRLIHQPRRKR